MHRLWVFWAYVENSRVLIGNFKGNPVVISGSDFEDAWDYELEPQDEPLLNSSGKTHALAPTLKRQVIESCFLKRSRLTAKFVEQGFGREE